MKKIRIHLFIDGSVNPDLGEGYGAFLLLKDPLNSSEHELNSICLKKFPNTSSTRLELENLIWSVKTFIVDYLEGDVSKSEAFNLLIYTDSQNIIKLPERETKLKNKNFRNARGEPLKNANLYQDFFDLKKKIHFSLQKVKGHSPRNSKTEIEKVFSLVDKATRKALREGLIR